MSGKPWWRAYAEAAHDPKLLSLSFPDRWHWFELLCLACANGGQIVTAQSPWRSLRQRRDRFVETLNRLQRHGLIDEISPGVFAPHNWNGRQFVSDHSTERTRRYRQRERHSDVLGNGPEQSRTEKKNSSKRKAQIASDWKPDDRDRNYARGKGWSDQQIDTEGERCRDHWLGNGKPMQDWHAVWRNWVTSPYQRQPKQSKTQDSLAYARQWEERTRQQLAERARWEKNDG